MPMRQRNYPDLYDQKDAFSSRVWLASLVLLLAAVEARACQLHEIWEADQPEIRLIPASKVGFGGLSINFKQPRLETTD